MSGKGLDRGGELTPHVGQLTLDRATNLREGQAEGIRLTPTHGGAIDQNRVGVIAGENAQFHFSPR